LEATAGSSDGSFVFVPLVLALYGLGEAGACCGQRDTLVWKASSIVFGPTRWLWNIAGQHQHGSILDFNHFFYLSVVLIASSVAVLILGCARIPAALRRFKNGFGGPAA